MKTLVLLWLFVVSGISLLQAQISLLYPIGGERLPNNGRHTIMWVNPPDTTVNVYLDSYDTEGNLLVENNLYQHLLNDGTNAFVLSRPEGYLTSYKYKVRLVGNGSWGSQTVSSDFIYITGPASIVGWSNNRSTWLPGQTRLITVTWNGFDTNQILGIYLECPLMDQAGYGYHITSLNMHTSTGRLSFCMDYPSGVNSAGDAYSFLVLNENSQIVTRFKTTEVANFPPILTLNRNREENILGIDVVGKYQTSYTLQSSTDYVVWNDVWTTNTTDNGFHFSTQIDSPNKIFRVREN